jgi:hypothetical protein
MRKIERGGATFQGCFLTPLPESPASAYDMSHRDLMRRSPITFCLLLEAGTFSPFRFLQVFLVPFLVVRLLDSAIYRIKANDM